MSNLIRFRVPDEILAAAEEAAAREGIPAASAGRAGGATEFAKRALYRALGLDLPEDPHEELSRERRGRANPHHPARAGRTTRPG
ncbi:MAG: hypothetical protein AMXMBFR33_35820 [Candidatus Xenobia bacterium]